MKVRDAVLGLGFIALVVFLLRFTFVPSWRS
jgi:hypothetical protein